MKLLFNGCSFVAGDCLTWRQHYPDIDPDLHIWGRQPHPKYSPDQIRSISNHYWRVLRPQDNLAAQVSRLTGLEAVDISADGNSNTAIAQSTVSWLAANPGPYIICIGWTEPTRRMVWEQGVDQWINLSFHRLEDSQLPRRFRDYIHLNLVSAPEADHSLDYVQNLVLLNSWARANGYPLVQWRSMGPQGHQACMTAHTDYGVRAIDPRTVLDPGTWLRSEPEPWWGASWFDQLSAQDKISAQNHHPNLSAVQAQAAKIAERIQPIVLQTS